VEKKYFADSGHTLTQGGNKLVSLLLRRADVRLTLASQEPVGPVMDDFLEGAAEDYNEATGNTNFSSLLTSGTQKQWIRSKVKRRKSLTPQETRFGVESGLIPRSEESQ
jgi:hypothetical protein